MQFLGHTTFNMPTWKPWAPLKCKKNTWLKIEKIECGWQIGLRKEVDKIIAFASFATNFFQD
jgi:hypothetical protein